MKICICRTADCPSEGAPFEWDDAPSAEEDEQNTIVTNPWCGGCSTQFTDIVAAEDTSTGS